MNKARSQFNNLEVVSQSTTESFQFQQQDAESAVPKTSHISRDNVDEETERNSAENNAGHPDLDINPA